jgi:hypothetical protein
MKRKKQQNPSIFQQVFGAVAGGTIALALYYAYDYGAPVVQSWLIRPGHLAVLGENRIADKDLDETDSRFIQSQARRIASTVQPIPAYSESYTREQPVAVVEVSSSSSASIQNTSEDSSAEELDTIWEQGWTEESIQEPEEVVLPPVVEEQPAPVMSAVGTPVPELPDSGVGLWLVVGLSGAAVGKRFFGSTKE